MTKAFFDTVDDHLEAHEEFFKEALINSRSIGQEDLHVYSQIKGQILTLRQIKDVKSFIDTKGIDDEREDIRPSDFIEDGEG